MGRIDELMEREWLLPHTSLRLDNVSWSDKDRIRIIRDDLLHPVASGNKVRKLDAWIPKLRAEKVTDVVTCGGAQSAHCAAVAALARENGMKPHLLLRGERPETMTGYALLSHMLGETRWVDRNAYADRESLLASAAQELRNKGRNVAIIPEGGADLPALYGQLRLIRKLAMQLPDPWDTRWRLVVDSGTGTTAAGLALGIAIHELPWEVYGVCLLPDARTEYVGTMERLLHRWEQAHRPPPSTPNVLWCDRINPRRFGSIKVEELDECRRIAQRTGILFDPIYTLAGWSYLQAFRRRDLRHTVLLHTGGQWNLFGLAQRYHWP